MLPMVALENDVASQSPDFAMTINRTITSRETFEASKAPRTIPFLITAKLKAPVQISHHIGPRAHFEQDGAREPSTARLFQGRQVMTRTQTCQIDTPHTVDGR